MVKVITVMLLALYDHDSLYFGQRVKHIWNKPWNSSKVLFIAKQIWNIRLAIPEIYTLSFNTIPFLYKHCHNPYSLMGKAKLQISSSSGIESVDIVEMVNLNPFLRRLSIQQKSWRSTLTRM
ncbi:hypothetical protein BDQ17DRAFT_1327736 [Cyathus striatus]|nr:hypothetical protein BDQ17DRAFT_1327736 [Cyathus striatus]